MEALAAFHPAVRRWFEARFPAGPTEPQRRGWPAIARGRDTLIAAPTGSGKTLTAFLVQIDRLLREGERTGTLEDRTEVVYVSPLKALTADVKVNLEQPLAEIAALVRAAGGAAPEVRVLTRSGDTSAAARAAGPWPTATVAALPESLRTQRSRVEELRGRL